VQNPRVERLSSEFRSLKERHDFSRAAAWEGDLGDLRCRLDQGTMEARPRADYTSADAARQALERHLRAWELWAELTNSIRVQFRYKSAQVVDRQSTPDSISVAAHAELAEVAMAANDATVKLGHSQYPPPPSKELATSPLVEELLGWVRDLRQARQRMLAAKNDPGERRKVAGPIQRLTDAERDWITAALPRVTRQVAEIEAASSPPNLNLGPP
jgi:hypothetical protein